ncbi:hypothetical protein GFD30_10105 [Glycomyces sp. NEAU-7082]|uniref:GNAT family N-acetyltransferase n=2 Tax=Glycomyces albidus TaxID=2656774 RepID=A0A6L5G8E5_9ACTN|nr:hypothetical protein [Glycomyces albidus]
MCRAHAMAGEFEADAWASPVRTPVFYPDAVTLAPDADAAKLLARIDVGAGASVKDSFADLDLRPHGFRVLFEAQWIHRPAGAPAAPTGSAWAVADDPDALRAWALAWDGGDGNADLFRPELLADPDVFVVSGLSADGRVAAGAVLNRSEGVVGVSNVFAAQGGPDAAWPVVLEAVHRLFPGVPAVGYEHGEDLAAAVRHGFEPVGPLRVWLRG